MAQIFAGADRRQIDPEVLDAFKTLPDDFWVFAEFTLSRNIDWFIVHPDVNGTLALIVIELKRTGQPLSGDINSVWRQWTPEGWRELLLSGPYRNYYWQAVEAANKLKEWLWNNQRRYRLNQELLPQDSFKVWPDLLILSPPGTNHQLPLQPPNNFGKFFYDLGECLRHIETWKSRQLALAPLATEEMLRLADALGMQRIWPVAAPQGEGTLVERVGALEERIRRLERALQAAQIPLPPPGRTQEPAPAPDWSPPGSNGSHPAAVESPRLLVAPPPVAESSPTNGAAAQPVPSLETVIGWIEGLVRAHGQGQPVRFADLGNLLKSRHDFDARLQLGLTLSELVQRAEGAGLVRVTYRDRVPYASLAGAPVEGESSGPPAEVPAEPVPTVRQKLGRDGLMAAVRIVAAAEERLGGRVVQTVSLLKQLREALPLNGGPALSNSEVGRLLRQEFVGMDYLKTVPISEVDLESGNLYTTDGYRLNREHPAVRVILDTGTATLHQETEVRGVAVSPAEEALPS